MILFNKIFKFLLETKIYKNDILQQITAFVKIKKNEFNPC